MSEFSEETLHRATFLHERDIIGSVAGYSVNAQSCVENLKSLPNAGPLLAWGQKHLLGQCSALTPYGLDNWVSFLSKLNPCSKTSGLASEIHEAYDRLEEYFRNEPYTLPFLAASKDFIEEIDRDQRGFCSVDLLSTIYEGLIRWYVSRAKETSRFVLHLAYTRTGLQYSHWCERFTQVDSKLWAEIAIEFPVLIRWLNRIDRNARASLKEMFDRLSCDRNLLETVLGVPKNASICEIETGLSDPHRGGRSVFRLRFSNGSLIIYKPKALTIDSSLNDFARCHGKEIGLAPIQVIEREDYGWVENIVFDQQASQEVNPTSIGRAASFFWLLNATDLHFENVVCGADGVYALDLETLLVAPSPNDQPDPDPKWRHHTINTTLLVNANIRSNNIEGISGFNPSPSFFPPTGQVEFKIVADVVESKVVPTLKQTDERHETPRRTYSPSQISEIVKSFELSTVQARSLAEQFIQSISDHCPLRFVIRDTYFYSRLLERMRQPRFLRDGAILSLDLLTLYGNLTSESRTSSQLRSVVSQEIRQLLQGDIPYFFFEAGGLDLYSSTTKIPSFFESSAKEYALKKVREIEGSDVAEQTTLLAIAFESYLDKKETIPFQKSLRQTRPNPELDLVPPLKQLAESIVTSAFCPAQAPARWLTLFGDIAGEQLKVDVGDRGFFGGSWGILLALQAVETTLLKCGETNSLECFLSNQAERWCRHFQYTNNLEKPSRPVYLGFSGLGGELFALSTLISLDPTRWGFLIGRVRWLLEATADEIPNDRWLDVIGGSAGLIFGCERLLGLENAPDLATVALELQRRCAKHLIRMSTDTGEGLAWRVPKERAPLLGYAHGWAGIVAALVTVLRRTADRDHDEILCCLRDAAAYPDSLQRNYGVWRDLRKSASKEQSLNRSWCHGVPGVLRGLLAVERYSSQVVQTETERTLLEVKARSVSNAYRFCCGEMGNIDFLLDHSRSRGSKTQHPADVGQIAITAQAILSFANTVGRNNREFPELSFPGLYQGQSGLLYSAARFLLPKLPSLSGYDIAKAS